MPLISSLGVMNAINFGMASGNAGSQFVAVGQSVASPWMAVFPWVGSGFGTKLSLVGAYIPPSTVNSIDFSFDRTAMAVACQTTPYSYIYKFNKVDGGLFSRYALPATAIESNANGVRFNPTAKYIAYASKQGAPNYTGINIYNFDVSTGYGTKLSAPAILPPLHCQCVCFNLSSSVVAFGHNASPYVSAYAFSTSIGTKFANPSTPISTTATFAKTVSFHPTGASFLIGTSDPPFSVYAWSSGFGSRYSNPATMVTNSHTYSAVFNNAGTVMSACNRYNNTNAIVAYPWNNSTGFGTKFADPAALLPSTQVGLSFNYNDSAIAINAQTLYAYSFSASGFGTQYTASLGANTPVDGGNPVTFSPFK